MIASIIAGKGTIAFNSEDLPPGGTTHNKVLYSSMTYLYVPFSLVDNGSVVNVCPWRTGKRLRIKESHLLAPSTYLWAYDNSNRLVLSTIVLLVNMSPIEKNTEFQVLDIPATFNLLLECPWLHEHQAVPSTLHQKIKILIKEEVVTIKGDNLCTTITSKESVLELEHKPNWRKTLQFQNDRSPGKGSNSLWFWSLLKLECERHP